VVFDSGLRPERLPLRVAWIDQRVVIITVPEHLKQQVYPGDTPLARTTSK